MEKIKLLFTTTVSEFCGQSNSVCKAFVEGGRLSVMESAIETFTAEAKRMDPLAPEAFALRV